MENGFEEHVANMHIATRLVHVGQDPLQWTNREVIPPIVCSTTYQQPSPGKPVVSFRDHDSCTVLLNDFSINSQSTFFPRFA